MKPWFPAPVEGWEETAEILLDSEKRWPEQAVISDMRWMVDQGVPVPGRPTLRQRWKWEDWEIRKFLANEDLWRDPLRDREPVRRRSTRTRSTSSHQLSPEATSSHQRHNERTPVIGAVSPAATSFHQPPPEPLHTRGDPPSPSPSPDSSGGATKSPPRSEPDSFRDEARAEPDADEVVELLAADCEDEGPISLAELFAASVKPDTPKPPKPAESPPPAAVQDEPPKPKPKRARKPATKAEAGRPISDLWAQVWRERRGQVYPSSNRVLDNIDLHALLGGLDKDELGHVLPNELVRLRRAFECYIDAADGDDPRCKGYAANVHGFRLGFAVWMQEADERADFEAYMAQFPPEPKPEPLTVIWAREDAARVAAGLPPKTKLRSNMAEVRGSMAWHLKMLENESRERTNA